MIPTVTNRTAVIGGSQSSASFGLSFDDEAHLMGILREGLYSDKVLAILREYSSNAWDAHRSTGKHDVPINISLPTYGDHTLRIRDYGPGLSHEAIFTVYTQYGRSTKRDTDDAVGMLGIGSKSGFAYSDSFTVTSRYTEAYDEDFVGPRCGTCCIYSATLGDDEKGKINLLHVAACDPSDTGVEIQIATKPEDRHEFERTAKRLLQHMVPRPEINVVLPALPDERTVLTHGVITPGGGDWIAVMGCVPYRVNLAQLDGQQVSKCLENLSGTLTFQIGGVAVSASREELKYTTATKATLVEKFNLLVDEFVVHAFQQLEAGAFDGWAARLQVMTLDKLGLPLPEKWQPFAEPHAKVTYTPDDFVIVHNKSACTRLTVTAETRLLIDDTGNELSGYLSLRYSDYVVRATNKTLDELRVALDAILATSGLTGVRIELLSSMYWTAPVLPVKKKVNPKHRARMFQLVNNPSGTIPWSDNWEVVTRVPTVDDVWVVVKNFRAENYCEFFTHRREDAALAKTFGAEMPTVYGYKTTEAKPVDEAKLEGVGYAAWRKTFVKSLLTAENLALIELYWQSRPYSERHSSIDLPTSKELGWLVKELTDTHPIVEFCEGAKSAERRLKAKTDLFGDCGAIQQLASLNGLTYAKSLAGTVVGRLKKDYPLLRRSFSSLWNEPYNKDEDLRAEWAEYVRLCDEKRARRDATVIQLVSVP